MNDHQSQQAIGSFFLAVLSLVILFIAWTYERSMMRHALVAAATWMILVVVFRLAAMTGRVTQTEARVVNGWFAGVVLVMLVVLMANDWLARRRAGAAT